MLDDRPLTDPAAQAAWRDLVQVNEQINANTDYTTDLELYGTPEFWAVANGEGDCEDYALAKRHALLARGWPPEDVRVATCAVNPGGIEDHAVLAVRLCGGDYILDNVTPFVLPWADTGYRFKRLMVPGEFLWRKVDE